MSQVVADALLPQLECIATSIAIDRVPVAARHLALLLIADFDRSCHPEIFMEPEAPATPEAESQEVTNFEVRVVVV